MPSLQRHYGPHGALWKPPERPGVPRTLPDLPRTHTAERRPKRERHPLRPRPGPGDNPVCRKQQALGDLTCPRDLNTETGEISPDRGNHAITVTRPGWTKPGIPRYFAIWFLPD